MRPRSFFCPSFFTPAGFGTVLGRSLDGSRRPRGAPRDPKGGQERAKASPRETQEDPKSVRSVAQEALKQNIEKTYVFSANPLEVRVTAGFPKTTKNHCKSTPEGQTIDKNRQVEEKRAKKRPKRPKKPTERGQEGEKKRKKARGVRGQSRKKAVRTEFR